MKNLALGLFLISTSFFIASCNKDDNGGQSTVNVRMTDAPTVLEEVNIDLQRVEIKFSNDTTSTTDTTGFATLNSRPGIYNLLALQNGIDTLIGTGVFPTGMVKEIRLILGPNNTVKENGQVFPLTIPSGSSSGLKIKINKRLRSSIETLLIDFDAALSVRKETDGYKLRPVIKLK